MRASLADRFCGSLLSDAQALEAPLFAGRERSNAADLLVRIAEIDARKLYLPAGYPSMAAYCVGDLRFTEDEAANRLHAARTARKFPLLFEALDGGKLDITAVRLLAAHLTEENVEEVVQAAATCSRKSDLQAFLHHRFPAPDLLSAALQVDPQVVHQHVPEHAGEPIPETSPPVTKEVAPSRPSLPLPVAALEWVDLRVRARRAKWQYARELLSHTVPAGDPSAIFDRALDALIEKAERKKFAACKKPRPPRPRAVRYGDRSIPMHVRRAVWQRDGGQCTFESDKLRRCSSRDKLEFDHIVPVARGGTSSVENLRLRCRGHNQYEAEKAFGAEFMRQKREQARPKTAPLPPGHRFRDDIIAGLRSLGVSLAESRQVVERSGALERPTLEESMRAALECIGPRGGRAPS